MNRDRYAKEPMTIANLDRWIEYYRYNSDGNPFKPCLNFELAPGAVDFCKNCQQWRSLHAVNMLYTELVRLQTENARLAQLKESKSWDDEAVKALVDECEELCEANQRLKEQWAYLQNPPTGKNWTRKGKWER